MYFRKLILGQEDAMLEDTSNADPIDPIEETEINEEYNKSFEKIQSATEALEDTLEVVDELQEQADISDKILENKPEQVTEDVAMVAEEALVVALTKLDYTREHFNLQRVTHEDLIKSPAESLRMTTEGIKDVVRTIIEKIKAIIKKIIDWIKKLFGGSGAASKKAEATAKKAKEMAADVKKNQRIYENVGLNLTPEEKVKLFAPFKLYLCIDRHITTSAEFYNSDHIDSRKIMKRMEDYRKSRMAMLDYILKYGHKVADVEKRYDHMIEHDYLSALFSNDTSYEHEFKNKSPDDEYRGLLMLVCKDKVITTTGHTVENITIERFNDKEYESRISGLFNEDVMDIYEGLLKLSDNVFKSYGYKTDEFLKNWNKTIDEVYKEYGDMLDPKILKMLNDMNKCIAKVVSEGSNAALYYYTAAANLYNVMVEKIKSKVDNPAIDRNRYNK